MNPKTILYQAIQRAFGKLGMQVAFDRPVRSTSKLLAVKARECKIATLLDVGANTGQFAIEMRAAGYAGRLVSFEPLTVAHATLTANAAHDRNWIIAPRMALGDAPGHTRINVSKNLASSSLLQVKERSTSAAPESGFSDIDEVDVACLDSAIDPAWEAPFAIKLDTQGFEMHVLRGASRTLEKTAVLATELSLVPLYEGGATLVNVFAFLEECGFRCIGIVQGFADHSRNELLQVDGIFVRN